MFDFHTHSYYSDGVLSPTKLLDYAKSNGVQTLALTDHDTISGLEEARNYAKKIKINFINGVEISATWRNRTIHIVGLDIDDTNQQLQQGLKQHQVLREERAIKIARGLAGAGVENPYEKTLKLVKKSMITRTHFAQMLINEGVCKDMKSVFKRFMVRKLPGGVNVQWSNLTEVIAWIKSSGGIAVLAHPYRYNITHTKLKQLISDFKEAGGSAIEIITAFYQQQEVQMMIEIANEFDLQGSIGSDYHGWENSFVKMGYLKPLSGVKQVLSDRL
ncbi:COG0613, Predicted metal-dependent phosphoesterases (PHP family) [hydrothermal vent metagenome]|uniref:COG0613, Predicted metal-dependent phosphoesterases (PHP family) n=1 Tax=hydrothermal vent metagenome TaxID=652676 RepID=A0A1W1CH38_9ZZZZ